MVKIRVAFAQVSNPSQPPSVWQYLARQIRFPKIQRHTPDKTHLQSGQGSILVIKYSGLVEPAQLEPAQLE
jgi:hypothetical protein